jgi:hypothetical protein
MVTANANDKFQEPWQRRRDDSNDRPLPLRPGQPPGVVRASRARGLLPAKDFTGTRPSGDKRSPRLCIGEQVRAHQWRHRPRRRQLLLVFLLPSSFFLLPQLGRDGNTGPAELSDVATSRCAAADPSSGDACPQLSGLLPGPEMPAVGLVWRGRVCGVVGRGRGEGEGGRGRRAGLDDRWLHHSRVRRSTRAPTHSLHPRDNSILSRSTRGDLTTCRGT